MSKKTPETKTLKQATELYLANLKSIGKKPSTIGTAKRTLDLLIAEMGDEKEVGKIMPVHISKFFKSEGATTLNGKPRAQASILQIRRIVRGALVFWHGEELISTIPLPADEKKFLEPKGEKKATKEKTPRTKRGTKSEPKSGPKSSAKKTAQSVPEPPTDDETDPEAPTQVAQTTTGDALIIVERPDFTNEA